MSDSTVKAILSFLVLASIIAGFFMKMIAPEVFMSVASAVVTHYFNSKQNEKLQTKLDQKEVEMQSLKDAKIVKLD